MQRLLTDIAFGMLTGVRRPFCDIRCSELDALQRTLNVPGNRRAARTTAK
jgi:hypothetical protein